MGSWWGACVIWAAKAAQNCKARQLGVWREWVYSGNGENSEEMVLLTVTKPGWAVRAVLLLELTLSSQVNWLLALPPLPWPNTSYLHSSLGKNNEENRLWAPCVCPASSMTCSKILCPSYFYSNHNLYSGYFYFFEIYTYNCAINLNPEN